MRSPATAAMATSAPFGFAMSDAKHPLIELIVSAPPDTCPAPGHVLNGGFELGDVGWSGYGDFRFRNGQGTDEVCV